MKITLGYIIDANQVPDEELIGTVKHRYPNAASGYDGWVKAFREHQSIILYVTELGYDGWDIYTTPDKKPPLVDMRGFEFKAEMMDLDYMKKNHPEALV